MLLLQQHQDEFHNDGLTLIDDVLPTSTCNRVVKKVKKLMERGETIFVDKSGTGTKDVLDEGGAYKHHLLDGKGVRKHFPGLYDFFYYSWSHVISAIVFPGGSNEVIISPYKRSAINIKAYSGDGATQGWHYDTNGITALLYFTTNTEGATVCQVPRPHPSRSEPEYEQRDVFPIAGRLLLMKGREIRHMSAPMRSETKIAAPLNYYVEGDVWRPDGIDGLVYGT